MIYDMQALLTISQRNFLMKEQIGNKILSNTKIYMGYEIFEVILIIAVAILQVVYLTRLLQGGSIVWFATNYTFILVAKKKNSS